MKMRRTGRGAILARVGVAVLATALAPAVRAAVISNVTATASSSYVNNPDFRTPDTAINGVGLVGDVHGNSSSSPNTMWLTGTGAAVSGAWFTVDLQQDCNVTTMRIWNYNEAGGWVNRGVAKADIYTALDARTNSPGNAGWTLLQANQSFTKAPGTTNYNTPDEIVIDKLIRYVGLRITSNWGDTGYVGLSELQFLGAPVPTLIVTGLTATASSAYTSIGRTANKAVNGIGLDGIAHTNDASYMWLTQGGPASGAWFRVDLGKVCNLARMDVWNYNEVSFFNQRGVKTADIYVAETDPGVAPGGVGWNLVRTNQYLNMAPGTSSYSTPDRVPMHHSARYVGMLVQSVHGNTNDPAFNYAGLSEVQFRMFKPRGGTILTIR